jgi:superfamily II DNA helicase RecQ
MQFQFFYIPATDSGKRVEELNRFLVGNRILNVQREFVSAGENSYWALCVHYSAEDIPVPTARGKQGIDYREILNAEDFTVYAKLRDLRRTLAEKDSVPAFSIFNNEQMANMVRGRIVTATAMQKIPGVGVAKVTKYGAPFLALLRDFFPENTAKQSNEAIETNK